MSAASLGLELLHVPARFERQAPPLLFVHGGFHGAWCWADHFMPWFADHGYDCHAVSYRGHGQSPRSAGDAEWRLRDYVEDVRWAANQLNSPPVLVGHSLGGSIVQKLVGREKFPAMVLLAPSPIGGSNRSALRMLWKHPGSMFKAAIRRDMQAALPAFLSFFLSDGISEQERQRIAARCTGVTSFKAAADAFYLDCPCPAPVASPVLVVSGERDWSIPRYKNEKLARAYGGDHIVVPTAHDIMCDIGWNSAAQQVADWLEEQEWQQS
jgi:pimeloyl-ACP methyl ester carboxylesterase